MEHGHAWLSGAILHLHDFRTVTLGIPNSITWESTKQGIPRAEGGTDPQGDWCGAVTPPGQRRVEPEAYFKMHDCVIDDRPGTPWENRWRRVRLVLLCSTVESGDWTV